MKARDFLAQLDSDPSIGKFIDCTSSYEMEADEMMKLGIQNFSPSVYLMKLLLGSIDSSYDTSKYLVLPRFGVVLLTRIKRTKDVDSNHFVLTLSEEHY